MSFTFMLVVTLLLTGCAAGFLSGLLGIGGGLVVVPVLATLFTQEGMDPTYVMQTAVGTSLAIMIFTTSASIRAHAKKGTLDWHLLRCLGPSVVVGATVGIQLFQVLSSRFLGVFFAVMVFLIGLKLLLFAKRPGRESVVLPNKFILCFAAMIIGWIGSMLGLSGGVLLVPLLVHWGYSMTASVAASVACGVLVAFSGTLNAIWVGWEVQHGLANALGFVYFPAVVSIAGASLLMAPIGVYWAYRLPVPVLKRVFGGFLMIVCVHMLFEFLS